MRAIFRMIIEVFELLGRCVADKANDVPASRFIEETLPADRAALPRQVPAENTKHGSRVRSTAPCKNYAASFPPGERRAAQAESAQRNAHGKAAARVWHGPCIYRNSEPPRMCCRALHAWWSTGNPLNKEIDMWTEKFKFGVPAVMVLTLAACGTPSQTMSSYPSGPATTTAASTTSSSATGYGVVESINLVQQQQQRSGLGLGTVAGAVVGGVLGNQIGSGRGRTAATIAGAAGGGLAGRQMEGNMAAAGQGQAYQVTVRMDNGAMQTLTQTTQPSVQIGDRVRLADGAIVERIVR
jgi:outer membrane lipoprotein SlyB